MARFNMRYLIQVTDILGDVAEVSVPVNNPDTTTVAMLATNAGAVATAVAQATNGKVTRQSVRILFNEAQYLVGTAPPTDAEYSSVTDGARFNFATGAGNRSALTIPAPIEALFGANSNVIDSTQANAAAVIAMFATDSSDETGVQFNLYKGGKKVGHGTRRRATKLIP